MSRKLVILLGALCVLAGLGWTGEKLYVVQTSKLPRWLSISVADVSSISVQGWGPGASGNFIVHPAVGQSPILIDSLVHRLPDDKAMKPHATAISQGGAEWLDIKLRNGSSIQFASFPNEPRPLEYNVTLTSASGKQEKSAMVNDVAGVITSAIHAIDSQGVIERQK